MDLIHLSPNFTLQEMLNSATANQLGIHEQYQPGDEVIANLTALCKNVLELLRAKTGKPVIITSGYRCPRLNAAIPGSAAHSQHELGQAADTHVEGMDIESWYQFIKSAGIPFDQLIQEFNTWAHVSFNPAGPQRGQCLRISTGTGYVADGFGTFKTPVI